MPYDVDRMEYARLARRCGSGYLLGVGEQSQCLSMMDFAGSGRLLQQPLAELNEAPGGSGAAEDGELQRPWR